MGCKLLICCKVGGVAQEVKVPLEKYGAQIRLQLAHVTCLAPMTVDRGCAVELSVCSACTDHAETKDALILCDQPEQHVLLLEDMGIHFHMQTYVPGVQWHLSQGCHCLFFQGLLLEYAILVSLFQLFLLPSMRSDAGDSEQLERNMESGTLHQ